MVTFLAVGLQVLLQVPVDGTPVRFGVPLPAVALAGGLGLRGPGKLQWRRLPVGGGQPDPVWVEVAICGVRGTARVVVGGDPACPEQRGPAFVRELAERTLPHGREEVTRWLWSDGTVDEEERVEFAAAATQAGETFGVGEVLTRWPGRDRDAAHARAAPATAVSRQLWEQAQVLPAAGRLGEAVRRRLVGLEPRLLELPGERGAGDFARSGGVVTNLEFDTTLGLLRLALATGDRSAFLRGLGCARHLVDRDLDRRTGLPFPHGSDHRTGVPEAGHAWLHGLLLAGLLAADDRMIETAKAMGRGLAARPPLGEGRNERARDYAWPLLELEALLAIDADPLLAAAADRLARAIDFRFDPRPRTFRFGEGEVGDGVYFERGWITGGLVVPALQRHLRRRPDRQMAAHVRIVQQGLLDQIGFARGGLPTHWRCAGGKTFAEHRTKDDVTAVLMFEGLDVRDLRRLSGREEVRDCLSELPRPDDPDLPTAFSIVARCEWIYR